MKASWLPSVLVLLACLFNVARFREELSVGAPSTNDHIFHFALVEGAEAALRDGGNPFDYWLPLWGQGFPVARYYQQLPHLLVVATHQLLPWLSLAALYQWFLLLGLGLLPLSFQLGARLLGFRALTCALCAACCVLLGADRANPYLLGLQQDKFVSLHGGMFAQLYGALLFVPALGLAQQAILRGRRQALSLLALSATWLSHLLLGYAAALVTLFALLHPEAAGQRRRLLLRYLALHALVFLVVSHKLVPALLESELLSRSSWEDPVYWQGFGVLPTLHALASGGLLDGARLPVLTALAGLGVLLTLFGLRVPRVPSPAPAATDLRERSAARFALAGLLLGLLLTAGHGSFGSLASLLPFGDKLPLHRFLCLVQLSGLLLAALALSWLLRVVRGSGSPLRSAGSVLVGALLLSPALLASARVGMENGQFRRTIGKAYWQDAAFLASALQGFKELSRFRPGRSYAGTLWDGGAQFNLAGVPIFTFLPSAGLPSLSYLAHTMGHSSDVEPLFDARARAHYDLFNVRYLAAAEPSKLPAFASVLSAARGFVTATVDTRGYFDLVDVEHVLERQSPDGMAAYRALSERFVRSSWHAVNRFVRVHWHADERIPTQLSRLPSDTSFAPIARHPLASGRVLREWGERGDYGAELQVRRASTVLFRMSFHPGWQAWLNGKRVPTIMLLPSYLGVPVGPGNHHLTLRYRPGPLISWLLLLGGVVLVAVFALERRRR